MEHYVWSRDWAKLFTQIMLFVPDNNPMRQVSSFYRCDGDSLASWSPYSSLGSNIFFLDSCNTYISIIQIVFCNALDCERSMLFYLLIDECKANGHQLYNFTSKLKGWKERKTSFIKLITSQYTLMLQVI